MKKIRDYFLEGFLIVFSVLFALFIENYVENVKMQQQKKLALERIKMELKRNSKILSEWISLHQKISDRLAKSSSAENDSLKNALSKYNSFDFGVLSDGQQLVNTVLTNTAWETAKSTGIITEFDFEWIEHLTQVYALQNTVTNKTLESIVQLYFDERSHDMKRLDVTIKQLDILFHELVGEEKVLSTIYGDTLLKFEPRD